MDVLILTMAMHYIMMKVVAMQHIRGCYIKAILGDAIA